MKYNYTGAAALWSEYFDLCIDDFSFCGQEKQEERRRFMYNLTRGIDKGIYINYIKECIIEFRPLEDTKSRCYDFEYERRMENLIDKIISFEGVKEVQNHD